MKSSSTRRKFLKSMAAGVSLVGLQVAAKTEAKNKKQNILFIAIDDLKPLINAYGESQIITPNLDALANKSTVFTNAHCQWAVCGPSRTSLMTSLMPEQTRVTGFKPMRAKIKNLITLPQHLKANGYITAGIGKIYDYRCVDKHSDIQSWSLPYLKESFTVKPFKDPKKMVAVEYKGNVQALQDRAICNGAIKLMDKIAKQNKPFFLGVGFHKPHLPLIAPQKYWDLYDRKKIKLAPFQKFSQDANPRLFKKPKEMFKYGMCKKYINYREQEKAIPEELQRFIIHGYYACISWIDSLIGEVLSKLKSLDLDKNTIICLWGDHGFHLGDHLLWAKHSILENATRVPLMIHDPQIHSTGNKTNQPAQFLDLYPTMCQLAGVSIPPQLQGISMVPMLKNPQKELHKGVMTQYHGGAYAYRTKQYRYIEWIKKGKIISKNLFDYANDPNETKNIANNPKYKHLMQELSIAMRKQYPGAYKLVASPPLGKSKPLNIKKPIQWN